jgi:NAD(P)-dependent dehydrogenase (short-subunit alcohol dehydrogenase family)
MPTAIVTGANRGIGLELCRQLAHNGWDVIAACRSTNPELEAVAEVWKGMDVSKEVVSARLRKQVGDRPIDLVINNAGIMLHQSLETMDWDRMRLQYEVNALGPLRVTTALLPNLSAGSKVAIVTSRMGSIDDNTSGGSYGYRMSKAAVNIAGVSLARDLADRGIAVILLHPGFVRTSLTGGRGYIDTTESVTGLLARIEELTLETSGVFKHYAGETLPW